MAGWVEGIRRALVLGLVLIAGTAIEQAPSVGPPSVVLIKALVMSRLNYSNGMLYGLLKCTVSGLQAVQNSAARIVAQERLWDHDSISCA